MRPAQSHVGAAMRYARQIIAGEIISCEFVRLACERQVRDLKRELENDPAFPYRFDVRAANRVCNFIELLQHVKGELRRQRIRLEPWQQFILCCVFGWVHKETGFRRFRSVYEEEARKNAKSTKLSAIGLYMLAADGEGGAECYSAATKKDQARIVFGAAQEMALLDASFRELQGVTVRANEIKHRASGSTFKAIDREAKTQDGLNPHFAAIDEVHAHKTREMIDVIQTGMGGRRQPLVWKITTAGSDLGGVCMDERTLAIAVLREEATIDSLFAIIYTLDEDDDWSDSRNWFKANPNLGVSVTMESMEEACLQARHDAAALVAFKTKRLCVWVTADVTYIAPEVWDACADRGLCLDDFEGRDCILGLDLAEKVDINAKVYLFPEERDDGRHYTLFGRYYLPERAMTDGHNVDRYKKWRDGQICVTAGAVVDYDLIEHEITGYDLLSLPGGAEDVPEWRFRRQEDRHAAQIVGHVKGDVERFRVQELPYDPYQAQQLSNHLLSEGLAMVEVRPTVLNFSEPMKELQAAALSGRLHHNGCPVMRWMFGNVVCHTDAKDNIYPRKTRRQNKIDGPVAAIMCVNRAMAGGTVQMLEGTVI